MDIIRVLRVLEYVGPREDVEAHLKRTIQSHRSFPGEVTRGQVSINAATIGQFPEILKPEGTSNG